jgi:hypothetical protein
MRYLAPVVKKTLEPKKEVFEAIAYLSNIMKVCNLIFVNFSYVANIGRAVPS